MLQEIYEPSGPDLVQTGIAEQIPAEKPSRLQFGRYGGIVLFANGSDFRMLAFSFVEACGCEIHIRPDPSQSRKGKQMVCLHFETLVQLVCLGLWYCHHLLRGVR